MHSAAVDCAARVRALCTDLDAPLTTNATYGSLGYRWFARYHLCPPETGSECLYQHRELVARCLASRTACSSRCKVAKATASAPAETRLFADIASQMVDKLRMHRTGASCFVNRLSRAHVPEAASSLVHGLVRPSCAIVGNSPLILGQRAGPSIDSHDVVIRFNFAPTRGFERDVGTKTSVRVMGKTWVWSSQDAGDGEEPIIIHRYNTNDYFTEDLQLNRGYNIATLDHHFSLHGFGLARRVKSVLGTTGMFTRAQLRSLRRFEDAVQKAKTSPVSSGFSGLLFAMYACSDVSLYGFDLEGGHPGHYYNDSKHGVVVRVADLLRREPHRHASFSVDSGLYGPGSSRTPSDSIRDQYTRERSEHPIEVERGIIRAWAESGCFSSAVPRGGVGQQGK